MELNHVSIPMDVIRDERRRSRRMTHPMFVEIQIGDYLIRPHPVPDGRVWIEVQRIDGADAHDHYHGPSKTIELDKLFADEERMTPS